MTAGRLERRTLVFAALVAAIGALVLTALLVHRAAPSAARAADHLDAPGLTPPPGGDGIGTDLTDIYAFRSPANAKRTVLIMTAKAHPPAALANPPGPDRPFGSKVPMVEGNPNVSYYFRVDSNGDAVPDVNIQIRFGKARANGVQQMRVKIFRRGHKAVAFSGRSTGFGRPAVVNRARGGIKAFAGRRDDPFFFNLTGFLNILDIGGQSFVGCGGPNSHPETDTFKGQNVSSIVPELPSKLLRGGGDAKIGVWATTNVGNAQIDRMGRPAINTVFILNNPGGALGGTDDPSDDAAKITGLAGVLLPDILTVDVSSSAGFLNGRKPADDVIDAELGLVTEGFVTTDCVGSNDVAFPSTFPYLAAPHS